MAGKNKKEDLTDDDSAGEYMQICLREADPEGYQLADRVGRLLASHRPLRKRKDNLRLILGLEKPDSGSVNLLGDYKYANVNAGVVFQEDRLCEQFSAVENVAMVNERLSETVAAEELSRFLPQDRQTVPVCELNETERRLVVMIRACIIPSDLLLLDEPFRGMDSDLRSRVITYIRDKAGHKGIVFVQRDESGLEFCRKFPL